MLPSDPKQSLDHISSLVASLTESVRDAREMLDEFRKQIKTGEGPQGPDAVAAVSNASKTLINLQNLEIKLVRIKDQSEKALEKRTSDVEQSRLKIGRRLARLRAAKRTRRLSE